MELVVVGIASILELKGNEIALLKYLISEKKIALPGTEEAGPKLTRSHHPISLA